MNTELYTAAQTLAKIISSKNNVSTYETGTKRTTTWFYVDDGVTRTKNLPRFKTLEELINSLLWDIDFLLGDFSNMPKVVNAVSNAEYLLDHWNPTTDESKFIRNVKKSDTDPTKGTARILYRNVAVHYEALRDIWVECH